MPVDRRAVERRPHEARPGRRAAPRRGGPRPDELPQRLAIGHDVVHGHPDHHGPDPAAARAARGPRDLHGERGRRERAHRERGRELRVRLGVVLRGAGQAAHVGGAAGVLGLDEPDAAAGDGAGGAVDGDADPRRGDRDLAGERGEDGERGREGGPQRADQVGERREVVALVEEEALDRRQGDEDGVEEGELDRGVVGAWRRRVGGFGGSDMGDAESSDAGAHGGGAEAVYLFASVRVVF